MSRSNKFGRKNSKKRFPETKRRVALEPKVLVVRHQDGSEERVRPNPDYFDGDYTGLAISMARYKERVTWRII